MTIYTSFSRIQNPSLPMTFIHLDPSGQGHLLLHVTITFLGSGCDDVSDVTRGLYKLELENTDNTETNAVANVMTSLYT